MKRLLLTLTLILAVLCVAAIAAEITIPNQDARQKARNDSQSGHASMNFQQTFKTDVPAGTNIMIVGITIDDPANGAAILAAIRGVEGVNSATLTAHGTVPASAPIGVHGAGRWEFHITAGLRGYTAKAPAPE